MDANILNIESDKDHFHILFKATPKLAIPGYINTLRMTTSRGVRRRFPEVKKRLWEGAFWSPYFLPTSGQEPLDVLRRYVES